MSRTLSKEDLIRSAWLTELRRQGHRQCDGASRAPERACALQLLSEVAGHPRDLNLIWAAESAGLTSHQAYKVIAMNDGHAYKSAHAYRKHSFTEVANAVEGWFAK